jgi:hypothetical protein
MSLVSVFKEEERAQGKSQTNTAAQGSWWIPTDPIAHRQLIAVLAEMAKCVLDARQQAPPESPAKEMSADDAVS